MQVHILAVGGQQREHSYQYRAFCVRWYHITALHYTVQQFPQQVQNSLFARIVLRVVKLFYFTVCEKVVCLSLFFKEQIVSKQLV